MCVCVMMTPLLLSLATLSPVFQSEFQRSAFWLSGVKVSKNRPVLRGLVLDTGGWVYKVMPTNHNEIMPANSNELRSNDCQSGGSDPAKPSRFMSPGSCQIPGGI